MIGYYDRDGNPLPDRWYMDAEKYEYVTQKRIARTVIGDITVSTVWLGLNHDYHGANPIIFETMTFGPRWANEMDRYSTEEAAMRGHLRVLDRLRAGQPPFAHLDNEATADA